jgi:hypothetical protein
MLPAATLASSRDTDGSSEICSMPCSEVVGRPRLALPTHPARTLGRALCTPTQPARRTPMSWPWLIGSTEHEEDREAQRTFGPEGSLVVEWGRVEAGGSATLSTIRREADLYCDGRGADPNRPVLLPGLLPLSYGHSGDPNPSRHSPKL